MPNEPERLESNRILADSSSSSLAWFSTSELLGVSSDGGSGFLNSDSTKGMRIANNASPEIIRAVIKSLNLKISRTLYPDKLSLRGAILKKYDNVQKK